MQVITRMMMMMMMMIITPIRVMWDMAPATLIAKYFKETC
jgi:hypothetical protein